MDEVRDGAPHVFFDTVGRLLEPSGRAVMLSPPRTRHGAIHRHARIDVHRAWEVERGRERHVQLATFDQSGHPLGEGIEVQSNDGRASMPALAVGDGAVGIATVKPSRRELPSRAARAVSRRGVKGQNAEPSAPGRGRASYRCASDSGPDASALRTDVTELASAC